MLLLLCAFAQESDLHRPPAEARSAPVQLTNIGVTLDRRDGFVWRDRNGGSHQVALP